MTDNDRASLDLDKILDAVERLYDASDGRDDLVGDVMDMCGDQYLGMYSALKMLSPYFGLHDRLIDALKKAPPKIAHDAEYLLRAHGWLQDD